MYMLLGHMGLLFPSCKFIFCVFKHFFKTIWVIRIMVTNTFHVHSTLIFNPFLTNFEICISFPFFNKNFERFFLLVGSALGILSSINYQPCGILVYNKISTKSAIFSIAFYIIKFITIFKMQFKDTVL